MNAWIYTLCRLRSDSQQAFSLACIAFQDLIHENIRTPNNAGGDDTLDETTLIKDIQSFKGTALAHIIVEVLVEGNKYDITVDPCVEVLEYVGIEEICVTEEGRVLVCCDLDQKCSRSESKEDSEATSKIFLHHSPVVA